MRGAWRRRDTMPRRRTPACRPRRPENARGASAAPGSFAPPRGAPAPHAPHPVNDMRRQHLLLALALAAAPHAARAQQPTQVAVAGAARAPIAVPEGTEFSAVTTEKL